jgi:hypothetical protein
MKKQLFFVLYFLIFFMQLASASLGITPAKSEFNFVSGSEYVVDYVVSSDIGSKLEFYVEGDLSDYVVLDKTEAVGSSLLRMRLTLPESVDKPGPHKLLVGAREVPPEDQFLGTAINIRAVVYVYVPYPGRYAEMGLNIPDGNIDEEIPVELNVVNRGKDDLLLNSVKIDFFTENKKIHEMIFNPVELKTAEEKYFRKFLDSKGYNPGDYFAEATINYGEENFINKSFRIGSLFVNITNFTNTLESGGIRKFYIGVQSLWNGQLNNVYADVNLSNGIQDDIIFRTPSVDLVPWELRDIESFLDTEEMVGQYNADIVLSYPGGKTFAIGTINIIEVDYLIWIILGSVGVILAIVVAVYFMMRKQKKLRRKR